MDFDCWLEGRATSQSIDADAATHILQLYLTTKIFSLRLY